MKSPKPKTRNLVLFYNFNVEWQPQASKANLSLDVPKTIPKLADSLGGATHRHSGIVIRHFIRSPPSRSGLGNGWGLEA